MASCTPALSGVTPGLGFVHLTASKGSGTRGVPRGAPATSAADCCTRCTESRGCGAYMFRPLHGGSGGGKCYLGNCGNGELPCFEHIGRAGAGTAGGVVGWGAARRARVCNWPRRATSEASGETSGGGSGLALLVLGHRDRLMFSTVPRMVISPTVAAGVPVDLVRPRSRTQNLPLIAAAQTVSARDLRLAPCAVRVARELDHVARLPRPPPRRRSGMEKPLG